VVALSIVVGVTVAMAGRIAHTGADGRPVSRRLRAAGWMVTAVVTMATVAYFARLVIA
jgi:hypothetical protein